MMGYLDDEAQTRAALEPDGWLRSGDVGRLEGAANMLKITGRVKELLITVGGGPTASRTGGRAASSCACAHALHSGRASKFELDIAVVCAH